MIGAILAHLLAQPALQTFSTPAPIVTASQAPLSERGVLDTRLATAAERAHRLGGTLGVMVIDMATGVSAAHDADTVMPLASIQKVPIALAALEQVDRHQLALDQTIAVESVDLVPYVSEIADAYPSGRHAYALRELISRMIEKSDNTAAKTLTRVLGGVASVNAALRADGIEGITLADDDRGTASARAVGTLFTKLFQGDLLSASSRAALVASLSRATTFPDRLRAGFPPGTFVAHKTGTMPANGSLATNDAGIATVNGRTLVVVALLHDARGTEAERSGIIADVARAVDEATKLFPL